MTTDLRDRIEASFGGGPPHTPIESRLEAGRRALRRRRLAVSGATVAVVAALVVTPFAAPLIHDGADSPATTRPSPPALEKSAPPHAPQTTTTIAPGHTYAEDPIPREDSPVRFDDGGRLVAKQGATITARVDDPAYSTSAIPDSCQPRAVAVTDASTDLFVLGYLCPHGRWDLFTETAGARADTLRAWLAAVKAAQNGGEGVR
jgi:hypothetical protein